MAEEKKDGGGGVKNDLMWFLGILFILWVLWFLSGGVSRYDSTKPFIKRPAPIDSGETYGPVDRSL